MFPKYTVLHNVMLAALAHAGSSFRFSGSPFEERELVGAAMEVVAMVGLQAQAHTLVASLAYGERRRVETAIALGARPKLLLLDEPLAGMGGGDAIEMVALIEGLRRRTAIVLVEHDTTAVFQLADRVSVLVYGKIVATGTPAEIRRSAAVREAYLGEGGPLEAGHAGEGPVH